MSTIPSTKTRGWSDGNRFKLLENGEEYFPAVYEAIAAAQREVFIETFILFDDAVGKELHAVLIAAAKRGVSIDVTVDGFGSPDLSPAFVESLAAAGVRMHFYDPQKPLLGVRTNIFRRLHRKIVSIDSRTAFIGGINFGEDQLASSGDKGKQDYSVGVEGPLARDIHQFARQQVAAFYRKPWWELWRNKLIDRRPVKLMAPNRGKALLVVRDNDKHRDDIERHYRAAIRAAKTEIVIACAYFFPGYRLLRQLRRAARRGVAVKLILQGAPDMPQAMKWAMMLYPSLLRAGVEVYEYCQRPLHAKVAVIDDDWSTIGSSNLDPLSLALNLEANVVIRDRGFNREVRERLNPLLREHCRRVSREHIPRSTLWRLVSNFIAYHGTRHFPRLAGWMPAHMPNLQSVEPRERTRRLEHARLSHSFGMPGER
ncbi:MAG TPA: cardiolipin synthase ClsB [Steroidobacteraceae bacterium]|nr:cardiolipin synthase ClsB [Steroidobacteraceae bacterium]